VDEETAVEDGAWVDEETVLEGATVEEEAVVEDGAAVDEDEVDGNPVRAEQTATFWLQTEGALEPGAEPVYWTALKLA